MSQERLKAYYQKLSNEAWLISFLCGASVGFAAMFVAATAFWLTVAKYYWVAILVWVAVTAGVTPLFYYKKYKPTPHRLARRVDDLGLEERLLTMTQLEGDDSYIAKRQREDTFVALEKVSATWLKVVVSVPLIIIACVMAVFGLSMTTVSGLASRGILQSGGEILEEITKEPPVEYEITYEAAEGGMIEGDMFQIVIEGENAIGVMAVPEDEYIFVEWSDGLTDPYREDKNITESFTVTATFQLVEESEDGEGGEGDEPSDEPGEGDGEGEGEGEPTDEPTDKEPTDDSSVGGKHDPQNQIKDGETYYGDEYEEAFKDAMDEVSQDGDLSGGEKDIIGDYFGAIQN